MGLGWKFFNPANYRDMVDIAKISDGLNKHMKKRCAYCNLDLGIGDDVPVVDFLDHMVAEHSEKISQEDIKKYQKIISRMTK